MGAQELTRVQSADGEIDFYNDGKHVRREYADGHARHGVIDFVDAGKHVRTEYT